MSLAAIPAWATRSSWFTYTADQGSARKAVIMVGIRTTALIFIMALGACDNIAETSEAERRIEAEQKIISAYSVEVPKADALLAKFLEAWKIANEKKELKAFKEDVQANVLPALDALVSAAEAMPLGSAQLRAIHAPLLSAYQDLREVHRTFLSNVTVATMDAEYTKVLEAMEKLSKAEAIYLSSIEAYYKEYRVVLSNEP